MGPVYFAPFWKLTMKTVLTMKWGKREYRPYYVNILHQAVVRNTTGPVHFVCLTDDMSGISSEVDCYPIPDIGAFDAPFDPSGAGGWPKLCLLSEDLYGLSGRILYLDLDTLVVGNLDPLFDFGEQGSFCSMHNYPKLKHRLGYRKFAFQLMTGAFSLEIGSQKHILTRFLSNRSSVLRDYVIEQDFVAEHARNVTFWPDQWISTFKIHHRRAPVVDWFASPRHPDGGTRLVAFHGFPRPHLLAMDSGQSWAKNPHYGRGPVRWVRQNWMRYGFEDKMVGQI